MITSPKIKLYEERDFGAKVAATFAFLRENFLTLLKYLIYALLPFCLVQSLAMNALFSGIFSLMGNDSLYSDAGLTLSIIGYAGAYVIGFSLLYVTVLALMRVYEERELRLQGLQWTELRPYFWQNVRRMLVLWLVMVVVFVVMGAVIAVASLINFAVVFIAYIIILVAMVPLSLVVPIYLFEDRTSPLEALSKSFRLGWPTWGGIVAVNLLLAFVAGMVQTAVSIPWYVGLGVKAALGIEADASSYAGLLNFANYLLGVVQSFGMYLAYSLTAIGSAYLYGHAVEKIDHVTMEDSIENFDTL